MPKYRAQLPQLDGSVFLTDGGLETTLVFHEGRDLPYFAAFDLMREQSGRQRLYDYYMQYANIALQNGVGFILESSTWRANPDWAEKLGYSDTALDAINRESIDMLVELRGKLETDRSPMVISGQIGPRGDGYDPGEAMTPDEAQEYHAVQIGTFADTEADMVAALTMTNENEAVGLTRAAQAAGIPAVISFTVETDGRLPTGQKLEDAIGAVDEATGSGPAYFMINCAHPTHFEGKLSGDDPRISRLRGLRANASRRSHEELDSAPDLDDGDPVELGGQYRELRARYGHFNVLGGCCGTDHRHVEQIGAACVHGG